MRTLILASCAAALAVGLSACGGDGSTTSTTSTTASPPPPTSTTTTTTPAMPEPTAVRIVVSNGKVDGGLKTTTVKQGDNVVLVVASDVADEVHLHGYDKSVDVTAKKPARLAFVASIPGRFEVELENRGLQIAQLEVRP